MIFPMFRTFAQPGLQPGVIRLFCLDFCGGNESLFVPWIEQSLD